MSTVEIGLLLPALLAVLLVGGVWIALGSVAWVALQFFTSTAPDISLATALWNSAASWNLAALPRAGA